MTNVTSGKIDLGVLGIETDVLYQWRNLVPTYEKRLTPIQSIALHNIKAGDVKFISRILGQAELPVENIRLKNVSTGNIADEKHIHKNVIQFIEQE